jgi:hypothetical protein
MVVDPAGEGDPTPLRLVPGEDGDDGDDGDGEGVVLDGRDPDVVLLVDLDADNES